jgi:Cu(I)/Ag(I) efflux system membrane fusion protein
MEIQTVRTTTSRARLYYISGIAAVIAGVAIYWYLSHKTVVKTQSTTTTHASELAPEIEMVSLSQDAVRSGGIGTFVVEPHDFATEISAIGVIQIPEPNERVIAARAAGRIEHMFVSATGTYVRKGQPLFEFYSPDILNAEREFITANALGMSKTGMTHTPGMDHSHSNVGLARAGRKRLELLGLTTQQINDLVSNETVASTVTITAPADGLVLEKLAQEGAYVNEGASVFQLADLSTVWAEVAVPESQIRFIRVGQLIRLATEAYPNENFVGRVIFISPVEEQASRSIRVRLSLPNPQYKLRPQMTFTSFLPVGVGRSLAVPSSAVIRTGKADYVWVRSDNSMFTRKKVTLGALSPDNYYQVVEGLAVGDEVVAQGAFLVDAEYSLTKSNPMAGMNMGEGGHKTSGEGLGTIRAINPTAGTITLDHGNIPGIMSAMTMAFKTADPKFLEAFKVNDVVRFTLTRADNGEYVITNMKKQ